MICQVKKDVKFISLIFENIGFCQIVGVTTKNSDKEI